MACALFIEYIKRVNTGIQAVTRNPTPALTSLSGIALRHAHSKAHLRKKAASPFELAAAG